MKWYKRDPEAFKGGTLCLSLEEIGAYTLILDDIYCRDGVVPDDIGYLCRLLRSDPRVVRRIRARLLAASKLHSEGGLLTNLRATSEISSAKVRRSLDQKPSENNDATPVRARATTTTRKKERAPNGAQELPLEEKPDPERDLFRRGKEVAGKNAGGLIVRLLEAKKKNIALARAVIETASTKQDPREYIAGAIRGRPSERDPNDWRNALAL